jgi:hypothetical protein
MASGCVARHIGRMRRLLLVLIFLGCLAVFAAAQSASAAVNPAGLFFDGSFDHIEEYSRPGSLIVAGNCNRDDPRFAKARKAGAEVIAYLNVIEVYDVIPCKQNRSFYMGGRENVPLWPTPRYGERVNWPRTHLADMRAGSDWSNHVVEFASQLMRDGKIDGLFLDNVGARLWSQLAQWKTWPQEERDAWTDGNIDLVRRLYAARDRIDPKFIIVSNNLWDRGDPRGFEGEKYVDGIVLQNNAPNAYHIKYAGRHFGDERHRRVLVLTRTREDALTWSAVPGVTHVTWQPKYDHPIEPLIPFTALSDRR